MTKIAVFASGSGTNAQQIAQFFNEFSIKVSLIVTNREDCGAIERAKSMEIPSVVFTKTQFNQPTEIIQYLRNQQIDFIILAGFLLKVSPELIAAFPDRIINLHPSLLPKYGGKGMYGRFVHEAVIANQETESGITIHLVNEQYDDGKILEQVAVEVDENETPTSLALKIQGLEHAHFPQTIHDYITSFNN
jgi:phosphoribosylglycinamide formyltransferase-1